MTTIKSFLPQQRLKSDEKVIQNTINKTKTRQVTLPKIDETKNSTKNHTKQHKQKEQDRSDITKNKLNKKTMKK